MHTISVVPKIDYQIAEVLEQQGKYGAAIEWAQVELEVCQSIKK